MYAKPAVGSHIKVITDWSDVYHRGFQEHVRILGAQNTTVGKVVPSEDFDDPASFRITTGNPNYPEAIISLKRVTKLVDADGLETDADAIKEQAPSHHTWVVEGSNGKSYTVTQAGEQWSCTCPGFGFRRQCKHVNAKKAEVLGV